MKQNANEGLNKTFWVVSIIFILFFAMGAILWWFDASLMHSK
ncbi:MAG: hypothetical protein OWR52_11290 [Acidibacillus sp.]|uniref:Uncharacterized protein n=1 Tax=Sulfoacidibacillus ferrooxidans TaxID=2005001 RepID=A0A9X1V7I4_9BACL|nr:hypothetical protein [Sulfoacidibacillus ferrooxidans]MCI0182655.1 hypothetical protein [Sulfoacidibacillus ferrooxidans]MCY0894073.1 hypothetical protein [Acidibacillus sp.]